jgi:putative PEP-CTERM system TPR-repeat lipoprotein
VPIEYIRYRPQLLLLNGQAHFGLGEREKAKPLFEAFNRAQPGSPVSKLLANLYLAEGNQDRAVDMLDQYLRAFPNDSQAMALLASAHMAKGRNARAAALMQEALRNRDAPELEAAYGLSLLGSGQAANALPQLESAYKKDPRQTQAAVALVGLYLRSNQRAKALTIAEGLVARQPDHPGLLDLLGQAKAMNNDAAGARAAFQKAIKLDPTLEPASLDLARLEMGTKNYDRAAALLDDLLKSNARNAEAMFEYANLAEHRGQSADALRWLQKAYDVVGAKDLHISLALVDRHMRQGRPQDALKVMQQVAANAPDDLKVLLALARVQLANLDMLGARATLTTATRTAGYDAVVQVEIALLQMLARDLPGAAYSVEKALAAKPDHLPAMTLMADIATRQGDFAKAEQLAQSVLKAVPKQAIGYSLLGDLAMARKQPGPAIEAYRKAHQAQPSSETLLRLFNATALQDPKAAIALAEQWLKSHPNDLASRRMLAAAHTRSNNMPAARREYERLRQLAPKDVGVLNNLANVLLRLNDPQALAVAEEALAADPNNAATIDTAGWIAFNAGKLDRAVQLLRDARLRNPESSETRYHLAAALVKTGRTTEARDELEAALRGNASFDGRPAAEALLRTLK